MSPATDHPWPAGSSTKLSTGRGSRLPWRALMSERENGRSSGRDEGGHGRRKGRHRGGERKQEYWDARCKVECKWEEGGEYKEERKCKGRSARAPVYEFYEAPVYAHPQPDSSLQLQNDPRNVSAVRAAVDQHWHSPVRTILLGRMLTTPPVCALVIWPRRSRGAAMRCCSCFVSRVSLAIAALLSERSLDEFVDSRLQRISLLLPGLCVEKLMLSRSSAHAVTACCKGLYAARASCSSVGERELPFVVELLPRFVCLRTVRHVDLCSLVTAF